MAVPSTRVELVFVEAACVAAAHRLVLLQHDSLVAVVQPLVHVAKRALADLGAALQLLRAPTKHTVGASSAQGFILFRFEGGMVSGVVEGVCGRRECVQDVSALNVGRMHCTG